MLDMWPKKKKKLIFNWFPHQKKKKKIKKKIKVKLFSKKIETKSQKLFVFTQTNIISHDSLNNLNRSHKYVIIYIPKYNDTYLSYYATGWRKFSLN